MKKLRCQVFEFKELKSTNSWLKEQVERVELPLLVFAEKQSQGRGRLERSWVSPKGGLYMSFGIHLEAEPSYYPQLMALVITQVIRSKKLRIKWPNDLFFQGKKVGGLLSEVVWRGNQQIIVIGLGLNIGAKSESIESVQGGQLHLDSNPRQIGVQIVDVFFDALAVLKEKGFGHFATEFEKKLIHKKGDFLTISQGNQQVSGLFAGLDSSGGLILENKQGSIVVNFGEVMHEAKTSDS